METTRHPIWSLFNDVQLREWLVDPSQILSDWLLESITIYLEQHGGEFRKMYVSFAWAMRVQREPENLRKVLDAFALMASTSDVGVDSVLGCLCKAKIAGLESRFSTHNAQWIWALNFLESLPEAEFGPSGFAIVRERFEHLFASRIGTAKTTAPT